MEDNQANPKDSIEHIFESILEIISQEKSESGGTSVAPEPMVIYATAEEGARLIREFIRINRPELRTAIIDLTTQISRR
jgi:hypothetical protein